LNYKEWLAKQSQLQGRDVSRDEHDYDLEGYYSSLKASPIDGAGHLPDTFKKPNHPTFSNQSKYHVPVIQHGGNWEGSTFTPSEHNLENMGRSNLQSYFNQVESPEALNLDPSQRLSRARKEALRKISGR
jgi:hypothetical protein